LRAYELLDEVGDGGVGDGEVGGGGVGDGGVGGGGVGDGEVGGGDCVCVRVGAGVGVGVLLCAVGVGEGVGAGLLCAGDVAGVFFAGLDAAASLVVADGAGVLAPDPPVLRGVPPVGRVDWLGSGVLLVLPVVPGDAAE